MVTADPHPLAAKTRILLIDDDAEQNELLQQYLTTEGFSIRAVEDGETGLSEALTGAYDGLLLDVMLPDINGIEVLRRIRAASQIPVIMLTARGDSVDRVVGLELGADDYVSKPCFPRELVARLRAVLRRQRALGPPSSQVLTLGGLFVDVGARRAVVDGTPFELTPVEFGMLVALLQAGGDVSTKEELSARVLGRRHQAYNRSVDVNIGKLRRKIEALSEHVKLDTVRGVGYRLSTVS